MVFVLATNFLATLDPTEAVVVLSYEDNFVDAKMLFSIFPCDMLLFGE